MELKERFIQNCLLLSEDHDLFEALWQEIEKKYSAKSRFYHNLTHLESMFYELDAVRDWISNFTPISFSVFYHDVIYDSTSKSNEEKSADFAVERLKKLRLNEEAIRNISVQILATKKHQKSNDDDINYLLDADLSVLGKDPATYLEYTQKIRKEYSIYPDLLYKPGRKKVLQHFLELESIFKTEYFKMKYEKQAKENLLMEIGLL
ncbi:putative metal-dependent HD superfamily phosphohydrolase [Chryseobacterium defluvii]|uniref:Putative metal-dependent HD superfamily phosphohydrolase n=1 Tax=Chryseobacterium defluvii TaxID=160396 RepID=A0A840K8M9_9FLAO|nr:hypothetical protein [Chryseobacterium defluvii]MBB4805841.1 putative metal-dependent HD superfamily phosphohydrolase [Chryseobacterium defluvii]